MHKALKPALRFAKRDGWQHQAGSLEIWGKRAVLYARRVYATPNVFAKVDPRTVTFHMSSKPGIDSAEVRSQQDQEALAIVKKLLHKRLKVVVKDGRVLIGELLCIDKQANLILGNTYQQVQSDSAPFKERPTGQVLVPASQRKSCHVEVMPNEREGLLHLLQAQQEIVTSDC